MIRLESIEDERRGVVTYALNDGRRVCLDAHAVRLYGAAALIQSMGIEVHLERVPVFQHGQRIGTVPGTFDPMHTRSPSPWFDIRPGDFRREREGWIASNTLGPGDLEAVPGFAWN